MLSLALSVAAATACDPTILSSLPLKAPTGTASGEVAVSSGRYTPPSGSPLAGSPLTGARIVLRSAHPLSSWLQVLQRPEDQEEWQPPGLGPRRVERLDARHIFLQTRMSFLFGAVEIARQMVVAIQWQAASPTRVQNCWAATDPTPWLPALTPFVWDAPWIGGAGAESSLGGWEATPLPSGGTLVSYQLWVSAQGYPEAVEEWAVSRTLPALMGVFEAHVGKTR